MTITETEHIQLYQLVDRDHLLRVKRGSHGYMIIEPVEGNKWARDEVADWRARHALDCLCLKHGERVVRLPDGP